VGATCWAEAVSAERVRVSLTGLWRKEGIGSVCVGSGRGWLVAQPDLRRLRAWLAGGPARFASAQGAADWRPSPVFGGVARWMCRAVGCGRCAGRWWPVWCGLAHRPCLLCG